RGITILGYTKEVGGIKAVRLVPSSIEKNPLRCPDPDAARRMERKVLKVKKEGDSLGGVVEVIVKNAPVGLGDPVFDKLEADLAKALLSIGAVRGFEVGNGFSAARLRGSENNDPIYYDRRLKRVRTRTNNAGGIAGGISNGEEIVVRIAVKPTSSIRKRQETVTTSSKSAWITVEGRHDPCICPRVVPVAESMVALTILDHLTRQRLLRKSGALKQLRDSVDLIDHNILLLLSERQALVRQIGDLKRRKKRSILDARREREILVKQIPLARELELDDEFVTDLFQAIFQLARTTQAKRTRGSR
ncbi:MAG: chorismate synthase, partial [Bacteroidota bacterium]